MSMASLAHPGAVQSRLEEIEGDLALRQQEFEQAAMEHFRSERDKEKLRAEVSS